MNRLTCGLLALAVIAATAAPALAQRRPHGVPPGLAKQQPPPSKGSGSGGGAGAGGSNSGSTPGTPGTPLPPPPSAGGDLPAGVARVRSFGSWLDDASVLGPGEAWVTVSAQRWASPAFDGAGLPVADVSVGVAPRVQAFATFPMTRYGYPGGPRTHEIGDMFVGGKVVLRPAAEGSVGLSVSPAIEIVGSRTMIDSGLPRASLVVPVNVELQQSSGRVYASGGFFTRGAWFAGAALERHLSDAVAATAGLSFMGARGDEALNAAYELRSRRVDAFGSVSWFASPALALFASAGRTLSALDLDATRYAFSAGVSLNVHRPGSRPPTVR